MTKQPKWLLRSKETYRFHREHLLDNSKWLLSDTAKALRRSLGSVCEDIKIAKWLKTHENQLEKFEYVKDVLIWIRKKEKEMDTVEID